MADKRNGNKRRRMFKWVLIISITGLLIGGVKFYTKPPPVEVILHTVARGTVERTVANTRAGTVKACRRAKLSPSLGGQIANLPIHEGDTVQSGQLLLELWNKDLAAQVQLAEKQIKAAQAQVRSMCAKSEVARRNADRLARLRKSDAASAERADNAKAEAEALAAECQRTRIEVQVGGAKLAAAQAALERTRLFAPFDGIIAEINGELYEYVTPSPTGVPTPPVVDIIGTQCFYVIAPIDEVDVADIQLDMPVIITLDAFAHRHFNGRVRRISDYVLDVEKQARTVDVEVAFDSPEDYQLMLAGYSTDIEVILETHRNVVMIPTEAVLKDQKVYIYSGSTSRVQRRPIKTGLANWDHTEIIEGLKPGDQIVLNVDNQKLKDGVKATPGKEPL